MPTISGPNLIEQLNWRYATKVFDADKKISDADWDALEEALVLTPSSFGMQPWKFIVVKDPEIREQLVEHSWNQRQVADASHLVVMAVQTEIEAEDIDRYLNRTLEIRGGEPQQLDGLRHMLTGGILNGPIGKDVVGWGKLQSYIALGNLMTSAALMGIDTCPMEGFVPAEYDRILGLESRGLTTAVLCPVGYRSADDKYASLAKVRYERGDLIDHID